MLYKNKARANANHSGSENSNVIAFSFVWNLNVMYGLLSARTETSPETVGASSSRKKQTHIASLHDRQRHLKHLQKFAFLAAGRFLLQYQLLAAERFSAKTLAVAEERGGTGRAKCRTRDSRMGLSSLAKLENAAVASNGLFRDFLVGLLFVVF